MFRKMKYQIRQCFQTLLFTAIFERMPFSAVDYTVKRLIHGVNFKMLCLKTQ